MAYPRAHLSLRCVDDAAMQALNHTWRHKDRTTDVLSFSQLAGAAWPGAGPVHLGDVVVSVPCAARQAAARGHSLEAEMARLLAHGVLHLVGHDHVHGGTQARRMRAEEQRLLTLLGVDIAS